MPIDRGERISIIAMAGIFVFTQLFALALAIPFLDAGYQAFENPQDPMNPIIYLAMILLFTGAILYLIKIGKKNVIQSMILFVSGLVLYTIFLLPFGYGIELFTSDTALRNNLTFFVILVNVMSMVTAAILTFILYKFPEWYVINTLCIVIGAGVTAILGISLGILPILILLIALAIYDAISVYKTKHMITLADAVTEKHLPVLLVVPKKRKYSYRKEKGIKKTMRKKKKMEALMMGLGDVVIPGSLAVSAYIFLMPELGPTTESLIVAVSTVIGGLVGFLVLMRFVLKGRPQAGLPLLNTGAILGFAVSYFLIFGM